MANKVFSNPNLCKIIASHLDTHAQDNCKRLNPRLNQGSKELQRKNLFRLIPDEIFKAVGEGRMRRVPIMNLYGTRICLNDLRERDLPAPIVIGQHFVDKDSKPVLFIAYKIHYFAEGRCCSSMIVKKSAGAIVSSDRWRRWNRAGDGAPLNDVPVNSTSLARLKKFFSGHSFPRDRVEEDPAECCNCLFSLFRNCFFTTDAQKYPYKMVLGS